MYRPRRLRPITRRRIAWLVTLLLLWQQCAMAAYACAVAPGMAGAAVHAAAGMTMVDDGAPVPVAAAERQVCQAHCNPEHMTQAEARSGSVQPGLFAALPPDWPPTLAAAAATGRTPPPDVYPRPPAPPASLLFCSLLI